MNKSILLPTLAAVFIGGAILSTSHVLAQGSNNQATLVERLATAFGKNQDDVQAVFDQFHTDRQAERTAQYEAKLTEAVQNGSLTDAQKQLILAKHAELQAQRATEFETMRNLSSDERRALMQQRHDEMEAWASSNGIDESLLLMGEGPGRGGEFGMGRGKGMMPGGMHEAL